MRQHESFYRLINRGVTTALEQLAGGDDGDVYFAGYWMCDAAQFVDSVTTALWSDVERAFLDVIEARSRR